MILKGSDLLLFDEWSTWYRMMKVTENKHWEVSFLEIKTSGKFVSYLECGGVLTGLVVSEFLQASKSQ